VTTRVRVVLSIAGVIGVALVGLIGTGMYSVFRNLRVTQPTLGAATAQLDEVRHRFPQRAPLIEIDDALRGRVHVNHPPRTAPLTHLEGFEILVWKADEQKLVRTRAPLWMMRFSTLNLLSELGLMPGTLQLTVDDVERYGPGVVIDFTGPRGDRALVVVQ
jgi:hypothetical protein